ncbi:MAG TPA: hypothetical protein VGF54_11905 [Streptosporangiaceae bacterium]|jgi:hypothetical protein
MSSFPGSPRLIRGGVVLVDPQSVAVQRVIVMQYNPDTLTRSLQPQTAGTDAGDRVEVLRLKGPAVETIKLEAEIDAADQLEQPDQNPTVLASGIQPQLAVLETIVYPSSSTIQGNKDLALAGMLEIVPAEAPLTLFIWGKSRIVPVRLSEFSITEEAFDPQLNPIRAKISLGMRVLSTNDFGFEDRGSSLYLSYQQEKERLARLVPSGSLAALGIARIQ